MVDTFIAGLSRFGVERERTVFFHYGHVVMHVVKFVHVMFVCVLIMGMRAFDIVAITEIATWKKVKNLVVIIMLMAEKVVIIMINMLDV